MDRITAVSAVSVIFFVISVIFVFLPLGNLPYYFSILPQFPLILLMVHSTFRTYKILAESQTPEKNLWIMFLFGAISTLVGEALYLIGNISKPISMNAILASTLFMLLAYALFIIGLWRVSIHVRNVGNKKLYYLPAAIIFVVIAALGALLFFQMIKANTEGLLMATFLGYLIPDFFLLATSATVVTRTWGGKLFSTYIMYGIGCLLLAAYQIWASFLIVSNAQVYDNPIQMIFMAALCAFTIGSDVRYKTEFQLMKGI